MLFKQHTVGALGLILARVALTAAYSITDTYIGEDFFNRWTWETMDDPTHGRVNYIDKGSAMNANLSYASDSKFVMRVDAQQTVPPSSRGRDSVRIISDMTYGDSLIVLDLAHMPEGCGTWPAFWTLSRAGPWPNGGEIDIIEGVHLNSKNLASLHTTPECSMPQKRRQSGETVSTDCDTSVNYNQGCGTSFRGDSSYGSGFNTRGGGWYVMERSPRGIHVWFWSRYDLTVPYSVRRGSDDIVPNDAWGLPDASFPLDNCDYDSHFDDHRMIFDTTFCGDWAGAVWPQSGCGPETCNDYVDNNPDKFVNTYWEINSLRVYT